MRINNNIIAQNSHRQYNINAGSLGRNVERLSSGLRVNRAADDAAGLAISEKMRTQIRGLHMASRNSQDGISLVQTAEGAMQSAHDIMQRMRELAVQSANGTLDGDAIESANADGTSSWVWELDDDGNATGVDRAALQLEFSALNAELEQIQNTVKFNGMSVFGTRDTDTNVVTYRSFTLQSGANSGDTTVFHVGALNIPEEDIATFESAQDAISALTRAINTLSTSRALLGATQNRLEFKIQNLDNSAENLAAAESRIRDADMAQMMTEFTRNNILFQASTAMLAQANALPQGVLQLLG